MQANAPEKSTWLDVEAVRRVAMALGSQTPGADIENCQIGDVKHVVELLARVILLEEVAPCFVASMLDTFLHHFMTERNRAIVAEEAQSRAYAQGFGDEWRDAVKAAKTQSGFKPAVVKLTQAAQRVDEETAVERVAEHYGIDPESLRRAKRRQQKK